MTATPRDFWCPHCRTHIAANEILSDDGSCVPQCPVCAGLLAGGSAYNCHPATTPFGYSISRPLAQLLVRLGIMNFLARLASEPRRSGDALATTVARAVIEEAAQQ